MNNFDKFLTDKSLSNEPEPVKQVHAIRLMILDKVKNNPQKLQEYYKNAFEQVQKEYNFRVVKNAF